MNSAEIRQKFLKFFEKKGHTIIPSASLVTPDEKGVTNSTLFNSSGMQPLVPYLLGEKHEAGTRLADAQKCVRTIDIDEVGDNTHLTFFEMLGNWSLGDYFKEESIKWSYELLTDKEEGLGLEPSRLYVTVFGGNSDAPKDMESYEIWKKYIPENRIYFLTWNGKKEPNWWDAGENGPAGPDTEIFYDLTGKLGDLTKEEYLAADERQDVVEIWNNVFMEYLKKDSKVVGKLDQKNVDTGAGLERWATVLQGKKSVFETDIFDFANHPSSRQDRIVADHVRAAIFIISDGVIPSNTDRGYVLRRLIRRAVINKGNVVEIAKKAIEQYGNLYGLAEKKEEILNVISEEVTKFAKTLEQGIPEAQKYIMKAETGNLKMIPGNVAFKLQQSYGVPLELTQELAREKGLEVDMEGAMEESKKHQEISKAGSEQKFKGGLAGHSDVEVRYHTATHLLHQALHDVLGDEVMQKGSNITPDRTRFDFSFPRKLTDEEKKRVEEIVNEKISANLPVNKVLMKKEEAEKTGARHFFDQKYPEEVSVYYIGENLDTAYSKEFCGGPHVENTGVIGKFRITNEESSSAGVRRIKAVLE